MNTHTHRTQPNAAELPGIRQRLASSVPDAHQTHLQLPVRIRERNALARAVETSDMSERPARQRERRRWEEQQTQAATQASLRAHLLERSALESRIVWFWTNHFSVFAQKNAVRFTLDLLEFDAIAPRALGRFSDLLLNASLHPAMLAYLDNTQNRSGKLNENLAREILELHTLGVDGGYTQRDVQQLTLALTGIGIADLDPRDDTRLCPAERCIPVNRMGAVMRPRLHEPGPKTLMGKRYARDDGLEALDMLTDLAAHPATARHIARKLATYWLQDEPATSQTQAIASTFTGTGGDLLACMATVLEIRASQPAHNPRLKDPFRHLLDGLRTLAPPDASSGEFNAGPLVNNLRLLGMPHHQRISPDGYPLDSSAWNSNATLLMRLQACNQITAAYPRMWPGRDARLHLREKMDRLDSTLSPESRAALEPLRAHPADWIAMYLMTPEVMFE